MCRRHNFVPLPRIPRSQAVLETSMAGKGRSVRDRVGLIEYANFTSPWHSRDGERWRLLDVGGEQLPRAAKVAASYVSGQMKPDFSPGIITGDQLVVTNVKDVVLVGDDWIRVPLEWQTAHNNGNFRIRPSELFDRDPCMLFHLYVLEELLKAWNRRSAMYKAPLEKLWLYEDAIHPHGDRSPRPIKWMDPNVQKQKFVHRLSRQSWAPNDNLQ